MAAAEEAPFTGERILISKSGESLKMILDGQKTSEVRGVNYRPGRYLLGCAGRIYGWMHLGNGRLVESKLAWERCRNSHRMLDERPPYPKTYVFAIRRVHRMRPPITFQHPRGAIGIVKFKRTVSGR